MNLSEKLGNLENKEGKANNSLILSEDTSLADLASSIGSTDVLGDINAMVYDNINNVAAEMRQVVHAVLLLDVSKSMRGTERSTEQAIAKLLEEQKNYNVRITTVLFNSQARKEHNDLLAKDAKPFSIHTAGTTRLYDTAIEEIKAFDTKYPNADEKVFFLMETDGDDNESKYGAADELKALIESQLAKGREFFLLAEGIDALKLATSIGVPTNRARNFSKDMDGVQLVIDAANEVIKQLRISGKVSADWSRKIDAHYLLTTGKDNNLELSDGNDTPRLIKK